MTMSEQLAYQKTFNEWKVSQANETILGASVISSAMTESVMHPEVIANEKPPEEKSEPKPRTNTYLNPKPRRFTGQSNIQMLE